MYDGAARSASVSMVRIQILAGDAGAVMRLEGHGSDLVVDELPAAVRGRDGNDRLRCVELRVRAYAAFGKDRHRGLNALLTEGLSHELADRALELTGRGWTRLWRGRTTG